MIFTIIITLVLTLAIGLAILALIFTQRKRLANSPPGPEGLPIVGNLLQALPYFSKYQSHVYFYELFKQYGDVVVLNLGIAELYIVSSSEGTKQVLSSSDFGRGEEVKRVFEDIAHDSLFCLPSGPVWKRHRKILQPAFGPTHLKYSATATEYKVKNLLNIWHGLPKDKDNNSLLDCSRYLKSLAADIIGLVAFRYDFQSLNPELDHELVKIIDQLESTSKIIIDRLLTFPNPLLWSLAGIQIGTSKITDTISKIDKIIMEIADARKEERKKHAGDECVNENDALEHLLFSKDEDGFSEEEIKNEIKGIFFAGFETTAFTLMFLVYCLAKYKDCQEKLYQEIKEKISPETSLFEVYNQLSYLDCFIKEVQRHYPCVHQTARVALKDTKLGGFDVPAGAVAVTVFLNSHFNEKYWKDPKKFEPERFLESPLEPGSYSPYGQGEMMCLGNKIAMIELKFFAILFLQEFIVDLPKDYDPQPISTLTFGFKNGLEVLLRERS